MDTYYTVDSGEDIRSSVAEGGELMIPRVEALFNSGEAISVYKYWEIDKLKGEAQTAYLKKGNKIRDPETGRRVDVLLTPVMPHPAVPRAKCKWVGYTKVRGLLDYTAVVLPGGHVDKNVDYEPRFEYHEVRK